jgi:hypothetical protein
MRTKLFIKLQISPFAHTCAALLSVRFATALARKSWDAVDEVGRGEVRPCATLRERFHFWTRLQK